MVASGWRCCVFGRFDFDCDIRWGPFPTSQNAKQKRKKSKKRSRSRTPPTTTSHGLKGRPLTVFKRCQECRRIIFVTHTVRVCCVWGMSHPMLNCRQCMAFTWKIFRGRFLCLFLWIRVTKHDKAKSNDSGSPSARVSTSILAKTIVDLEGQERYQGLTSDAVQYYKQVNSQTLAPLDFSSPLSPLEESASSAAEGERGGVNSSSLTEDSSSQCTSVQTTADVRNVNSSSQFSSQDCQKSDEHRRTHWTETGDGFQFGRGVK